MLPGPPTQQGPEPELPGPDDASTLAASAWALVGAEPRQAQRLATRALSLAQAARDPASASVAYRTLGMTALDLVGVDEAIAHLRHAVTAGRRAQAPPLIAEAEMGLALALQHHGDAARALHHAAAAVRMAPGVARLGLQRGLIQERLGQLTQALDTYGATERLARATGDQETLARVRCNRGVLLTYRGDYAGAETDILAGEALCLDLGLTLMAAGARSNLGYLAARRGNVVEALRWLESARPELEVAGDVRHGVFQYDLCEVLMLAGLSRDAVEAGRRATDLISGTGMQAEFAEARLLTAQAALRDGDPVTAETLATAAGRAFSRQRRGPWAALAREVVVQAQWATGRRDDALLAAARRTASLLETAGWGASANSARILAARIALELGRPQVARVELRLASEHRRGPVGRRIQALHAHALLLVVRGEGAKAQAALEEGWTVIEDHRATLGATELRVGAASHTQELAELGVRLAVDDGQPAGVLAWAERGRAGTLHQRATHAPTQPELAESLESLRAVVAELDVATKHGGETRRLLRQQAELEEHVRRQARLASAADGGAARAEVAPDELHAALGDRALVELVVDRGELLALVAAGGELALHRLGSAAVASRESGALRMALGRLASGAGTPAPLRAAAREAVQRAAAQLADQLFEPLAAQLEGRPLVIVPTGAFHGTPWAALPGIAESLSVAPSAALWMRGHAVHPAESGTPTPPIAKVGSRVLVAAGPNLAHADEEAEAVARCYPAATLRLAADATVDEIRTLLPEADLAHIACHGHFRDDNPLFSALELTGGRLSVFELERLERVPRQLVLSACDSGRSAVRPGDELIGLTAALLRLGTQSLIASVMLVPDDATRRLMTALHAELSSGAAPPDALAAARQSLDLSRDDDLVAAAAFVAFGSD